MRKVFYVPANLERYQAARSSVALGDLPQAGKWDAPLLYIENPYLPRADFVSVSGVGIACPVSLVRAEPSSLIERDCFLYPCRIEHESQDYVIFRPKRVVGAETLFTEGVVRKVRRSVEIDSGWLVKGFSPGEVFICLRGDREGEALLRFFQQHTGLDLRLVEEGDDQ